MPNLAIVCGFGVVGLTTSIRLLEKGYRVFAVAEHLPGDDLTALYASSAAGAHHLSFAADDDARQQAVDRSTFDVMWDEERNQGDGSGLMKVHQLEYYGSREKNISNFSKFRIHSQDELKPFAEHAVSFTSLTIDVSPYLAKLVQIFSKLGGIVHRSKLVSLRDAIPLAGEEETPLAIFNCTGLGSRTLEDVMDDEMYPIRGQVVVLNAPWVKEGRTRQVGDLAGGEGGERTYIIPRKSGEVVIGGTRDIDDWNPNIVPETSADIKRRALEIFPELVPPSLCTENRKPVPEDLDSIVLREVVGFRPARKSGMRINNRSEPVLILFLTMASDSQLSAFIDRTRELLRRERDAEIEKSSLLLSNCGPKLLEQKGLALLGLGVQEIKIGLGGKTLVVRFSVSSITLILVKYSLVELERPSAYHTNPIFPPHTLRPGDLARIEANITAKINKKSATPDSKDSAVEGVVYKVSDTRIVIAVDNEDDLNLPERCRVVKLANSVTALSRMDRAIDQLEKTTKGEKGTELTPLIKVLMGMMPPSLKDNIDNLTFFDNTLNPSQKEAVKFCLASPEVACIHGPPGTGKTHTLIEIIRQLTTTTTASESPKRILVCGASNISVDNILERLLALPAASDDQSQARNTNIKVTRIGHPARVMTHQGILDSTLDIKAARTDQAVLVKDIKSEIEMTLGMLSGKGKGVKGRVKGVERKKLWDEVKALRKEYRKREGGIVASVLHESQIVVATCHSSGGRHLRNQEFDVVIIDEATQAVEAVCWIPIFKAKKLILAGDPMQLPPTVLSLDRERKKKKKTKEGGTNSSSLMESEPEAKLTKSTTTTTKEAEKKTSLRPPKTLETTLFDRLEGMYGSGIKKMLDVQYRMHKQICTFPSQTLYSGKLTSHSSVAEHLLSDLIEGKGEDEETRREILGTPVTFFDTAGCEYFERVDGEGGLGSGDEEGSRCNENEAIVVKQWIDGLVDAGIGPERIAVITPYQAQVTLLTSILRPVYGTPLEIGTVDGMQGREKDAVVVSLVRSNDKREVGFLKEMRRLNVAMTRAKRHLCVIGDSSTVTHGGSYLKKWMQWLDGNADVRYAGND
ncbi:hypothetical protein D9757_000845 [Collybiopsis confluens]|uniref:DNA helicase n=1 Tax=Collybiopsis confluens TaxID=2823264 RepID=A0A8H5I0D4_9AGAR|nr:hypothetical protein D9757_000845 [Collybiopsis confluens]